MRALVAVRNGGPEALELREVPDPVPGPHDLLVEVRASALNPVDYKILGGGYGQEPPFVLGFDVSGVVRAAGADVRGVDVGDAVYASPSLARDGAFADLVLVDARTAARKPASLDHLHAAALPLVTLTAWESLHDRAAVRKRERVLVQAGGGGVGHVAIQLAKLAGARVLATASEGPSRRLCEEAGADVVIDYREEDVVARVEAETGGRGCDVVLDAVGGETFEQSMDCLAINGRLVTIVMNEDARPFAKLFRRNASLHFEFMGIAGIHGIGREAQGEKLRKAAALADHGELRPHVGRVVPLEGVPDALRELMGRHATGKTVVDVAGAR